LLILGGTEPRFAWVRMASRACPARRSSVVRSAAVTIWRVAAPYRAGAAVRSAMVETASSATPAIAV
jgi:hypothetical protein